MAANPIDPTAPTPAATADPGGVSAPAADRQKVVQLAQQFEAMLINQMLSSMRQSMLDDEKGQGLGAETMTDAFYGEMANALSKQGGFGLSGQLLQALERQQIGTTGATGTTETSGTSGASGASGANGPIPASIPASFPASFPAATPVTTAAPVAAPGGVPDVPPLSVDQVTSAFGWRSDPIDGRLRFHAGTDLRAAYGQEVDSVAPGRVAFAGEQSGYGLTVVVDHGNGLQTRYAHLSAANVQAGGADRVRVSSDAQLASTAIKAATQASDIRPDKVERAKALLADGKIGTDPHALANKLIDRALDSDSD